MADPTAERDLHLLALVRDRTIKGVSAMFLRQLVVIPVSLLATIFLARLLKPTDFGIYGIASFWIYMITGFRDQGFGPALIQQKRDPSKEEWNTIFTFQTVFVSVAGLGLYLGAAPLIHFYRMDPQMVWVVRGLSLVLFVGLLGSVTNVMLERRMAYDVIAKIEVLAALCFYIPAVGLALAGFGVWSFIGAAIASEVVRALLLFRSSSWRIGLSWKASFLRSALKFGSLFQLGGFTSLLRDNIAPLLAGPLFGPAAVGYLKWAERTSYLTSQVFTQIVTRVSFPSLSRLQEQPVSLGRAVQKMVRYLMLATVPSLAVAAALIGSTIEFVFSNRWEPAMTAYYLLTVRMLGGNITTPFIGVLNALGRVSTSLRILTLWTLVDWGLALILTYLWGFNGVALAYALGVFFPVIWLVYRFRRVASINFAYAIGRPITGGIITFGLTWVMGQAWISGLLSLAAVALLGLLLYPLTMLSMERGQFLRDLQFELKRARTLFVAKVEEPT